MFDVLLGNLDFFRYFVFVSRFGDVMIWFW